jgi:hypothetical protein
MALNQFGRGETSLRKMTPKMATRITLSFLWRKFLQSASVGLTEPVGANFKSKEEEMRRNDMTIRTRESTVTFERPFTLSAFERPQPAGTYRLVTDEEEILGLSFLAYRQTAAMLHTPAISTPGSSHQVFVIDSEELTRALEVDARRQVVSL